MTVLTPEELKKLPMKERMAYKLKMKGFEEYKPTEKAMTEEDLMVEYMVANYNVTIEQAQMMF